MIDPVSALTLKTGTSWLAGKFKSLVVEKWSRRRAEAFFQTFVERVITTEGDGRPLRDLEPLLSELLDDEIKSEVMFDAYRKVCLSASHSFGPRIIAVITARLVRQGRVATPDEERIMMVAESFGDKDFTDFSDYLSSHALENNAMKLFDDSEDSNSWGGTSSIGIGPVNLGEQVGNWCLKLTAVGLATQEIDKRSRDYDVDTERHIDEPGTVTTYTWKLVFQPEAVEFKQIIDELRTHQHPAKNAAA